MVTPPRKVITVDCWWWTAIDLVLHTQGAG
jgi:hypothetical protein